jgi:ribonucleoside-diphosphate reductase alpha chain
MTSIMETPSAALDFYGNQPFPADTWFRKYAMRDKDENVLETDPMQTRARLAKGIGAEPGSFMEHMILQGAFVAAGRIQFALGNPYHKATYKNCYVLPILDDSIEGIFDTAKESAKTFSYGGGVGIPLNPLRPDRAKVSNCAIYSSGAASFAEVFSTTTGVMGQHGRRGAEMLQIHVEHPDVEHFIDMKADVEESWLQAAANTSQNFKEWMDERRRVRFANVSVQLSDTFMKAVRDDTEYEQRFEVHTGEVVSRTVKAREVWGRIIHRAWKAAEPGLVFWDHMVRESPSDVYGDIYRIICTNPCGEQPLEPYGACCLGHVNASKFVRESFTEEAYVDWDYAEKVTRNGVRFLDTINTLEADESRAPLPQMAEANLSLRRIGLGVLGVAEMFIRLGIQYGSNHSVELIEGLFRRMANWAYDESAELAKEKGPFLLFDWEKHKNVPIMDRLDPGVVEKIKQYGLRNVTTMTVAPTGTTAAVSQTSCGIDPYFVYVGGKRRVFDQQGNPSSYTIHEKVVYEWAAANGIEMVTADDGSVYLPEDLELPSELFVEAYDVDWRQRVRMQGAAQKWVDASISSTINLPGEATEEEIGGIYMAAWEHGLKGITVYRSGCREPVIATAAEVKASTTSTEVLRQYVEYELPEVIDARRVAFRDGDGHRILIHLGFDPQTGRPIEVTLCHGKGTNPDLHSSSSALGIMVSKSLQAGLPVDVICKALRGIQASWQARIKLDRDQKRRVLVKSVPDAIAVLLMRYRDGIDSQEIVEIQGASICPACKRRACVNEGGCLVCRSCSYAKCND